MKSIINKVRFTIVNNKLFSLFLLLSWMYLLLNSNTPMKISVTLLMIALFQNEYIKTRYSLIVATMLHNLEEETKMAIKLSDERINTKGE